ncbi:MAG: glycosyltransferase family 4 protein [Candidatus Dormibacteria bacterium]
MPTLSFDARELRNPAAPQAGISRYIRGIVPAIAREEPRLQIVAHVQSRDDVPRSWYAHENLEVRELPGGMVRRLPLVWPHFLVPRTLGLDGRATLIHGPANSLPLGRLQAPALVTLHDLAIYEHPEWYPDGQWLSLRRVVPWAVARARLLICVSQRTAREVGRIFPLAAGRTRVVPNGLEEHFHETPDEERRRRTLAEHGITGRFVLAVGTVEPRKGFDVLIQAFAELCRDDHETTLLLAGGAGWKNSEVLSMPERLGLGDRVRFVGFVDDVALRSLMAECTAFVVPSLDEGFGFPALEAMAAGAPVVATHAGAIPEVTGDAALLVRPGDAEALQEALRRILRDPDLRGRLSTQGRARAGLFTWAEAARGTLRVYREAGLRL